MRSLLFVPADRPDRFVKAQASGADAIILDLEDSVAPARKAYGRNAIREWLSAAREGKILVRINPLGGPFIDEDILALSNAHIDGIILPKAEGAASILALHAAMMDRSVRPLPLILPIATETPAAIFELGSYRSVAAHLLGLTWGAEDLPAAIGATASREDDGRYTPPYETIRSLSLFAAHAAGVAAIDAIFPRIDAPDALAAHVARARRDGFTGMMAIHPAQVAAINAGFTPTPQDIARAQAIIDAFAAAPDAGTLQLDGRMIDRPHLVQARKTLELAQRGGGAQGK